MGVGGLSYEKCREKRVEENKKRLEDLNLIHLSQSLKNLSPKSSPMKKVGGPKAGRNTEKKTVQMKKVGGPKAGRNTEKKTVQVRRSARVANNPAPVYAEITLPRLSSPNKSYGVSKSRHLSFLATHEVREHAIQKAEKLNAELADQGFPTVIRPLLPSHVSSCFWLGLPTDFCRTSMPKDDGMITLVDEGGDEYPVVYLARKRGLSGGWKGFAESYELVDGDAVIFQLISTSVLKVYIIRGNGIQTDSD